MICQKHRTDHVVRHGTDPASLTLPSVLDPDHKLRAVLVPPLLLLLLPGGVRLDIANSRGMTLSMEKCGNAGVLDGSEAELTLPIAAYELDGFERAIARAAKANLSFWDTVSNDEKIQHN